MLQVVTLTHPGLVREKNEDAVLWDPALGLLAVADGMGGHNAGEVASQLALDVIRQSLQATERESSDWPFGFSAELPLMVNRLRTAIQKANRAIYEEAQERSDCTGMGTTVTVGCIDGSRLWYASVGDSRLYAKGSGESALRQLTRDDSVVGMLAESPNVKPATLVNHPMRHLLTNVLGPRPDVVVEVEHLDLADSEVILLTSDGMHGAVGDPVIDAILDGHEHGMDLHAAAEHLVEAALGAGGRDNITIALARYSA